MLDATLHKYTLSLPKNQTLPKIVIQGVWKKNYLNIFFYQY